MASIGSNNVMIPADQIGIARGGLHEGYATPESVAAVLAPLLVATNSDNTLTTGIGGLLYVPPGASDYVSNVALAGQTLVFTAVGGAFSGAVDLSPLVSGFLTTVVTDATLTGDGTAANPLSVAEPLPAPGPDGDHLEVVAGAWASVAQPVFSVTDNGDGTYTITHGTSSGVVDTRAPSNPFDGSTNFFVTTYQGNPVDDVDTALRALSAAVTSLIGSAQVILQDPTFYIRAGGPGPDGLTPATAFPNLTAMEAYLANALVLGSVTIDASGTPVDGTRRVWTPVTFRGADSVLYHGDPANPVVHRFGTSASNFDHAIVADRGLDLTLRDLEFEAGGVSPGAIAIVSAGGARITLDSSIRVFGPGSAGQGVLAVRDGGVIQTLSVNQPTPTCTIRIEMADMRRAFLADGQGSKIDIPGCLVDVATTVTVADEVFYCFRGGAFSVGRHSSSTAFQTTFGGAGSFSGDLYRLEGTGSALLSNRTSLSYTAVPGALDFPSYFNVTGTALQYNGIGTYTDLRQPVAPAVGGLRHGQTGTYWPP